MADVKPGEMVLYDYIRPPLLDGSYRLDVSTEVKRVLSPGPATDTNRQTLALDPMAGYFNVVGPRFSLAPAEVGGVFPPRNGHGAFHDALPHVALGRRTLPWERVLATTLEASGDGTPYPWVALVLFEEDEHTMLTNVPLEQIVPASVFAALGSPAGVRCDAVEADRTLLQEILPTAEDMQLLTHVRQVNVDDRELSAGDSDGFFAVVMSNRLPREGAKHRACLVSMEARTDLLPKDEVDIDPGLVVAVSHLPELTEEVVPLRAGPAADASFLVPRYTLSSFAPRKEILDPNARLVVLHSWTFECTDGGTFREILQKVNVGMIGDVADGSKLEVVDTGHIPLALTNRDGAAERVLYRGPLVGAPLARDPNGPYHSADQAIRTAADAAGQDISYACAFEVGRLLAAADARLAQELMRWRRGAYRQAVRVASIQRLAAKITMLDLVNPRVPVAALFATSALGGIARGAGPLVDPYGVAVIDRSPLLDSALVKTAFNLDSVARADELLGRTSGVLDTKVPAAATPGQTFHSIEALLGDAAGARDLHGGRTQVVNNAAAQLDAETRTR